MRLKTNRAKTDCGPLQTRFAPSLKISPSLSPNPSYSENRTAFRHIFLQLLQARSISTKEIHLACHPWKSTPVKLWLSRSTMTKCLLLLRAVWLSTKTFLESPTHSESTTKFLFLSTTLERWRTLVVSHSTRTIFSEAKHQPSLSASNSLLQICTNWHTCGSATSLQWNGGMTSGLMNLLPRSCRSWQCSTHQTFNTSTRLVGFHSSDMLSGEFQRISCQVHTLFVQISYQLTKLRVFLMVSAMARALLSWSNFSI